MMWVVRKKLSGTCKKRLPASVARNFSWWELPVCSSRPSMQHFNSMSMFFAKLKHLHIFLHCVLRYEEIYAPEIKDFVYITGLLHGTLIVTLLINFYLFLTEHVAWILTVMVEIADHAYSEREIQKMEVQVLSVLKWVKSL